MTQNEIAKSLGLTQSAISNKLRLLKLDENMQKRISEAGLGERHARVLLRLESESDREVLLERMCKEGLSVRHSEALADLMHSGRAPERIESAGKARATDEFIKEIKTSAGVLSSLGIDVNKTISYHKNKIYVTVVITEK